MRDSYCYLPGFLFLSGDTGSDLNETESDSDSDGSDRDSDFDGQSHSSSTSVLDSPGITLPSSVMAEEEFQAEVVQSLERAFEEGHSVDNAAVELKTLRMASNVPLTRVRESVVAAIVERIKLVDGVAQQRAEIAAVLGRWGALIDQIGGVDAVETLSILQVQSHCKLPSPSETDCVLPRPTA